MEFRGVAKPRVKRSLLLCTVLAGFLALLSYLAKPPDDAVRTEPLFKKPAGAATERIEAPLSNEPLLGVISFRQVAFALLLTALAGTGAFLLVRKTLRRSRLVAGGERILRVLDAIPLAPRRHVYVVSVKDRILVLGVGPDSVNALAEMDLNDVAPENPSAPGKVGAEFSMDAGKAFEASLDGWMVPGGAAASRGATP